MKLSEVEVGDILNVAMRVVSIDETDPIESIKVLVVGETDKDYGHWLKVGDGTHTDFDEVTLPLAITKATEKVPLGDICESMGIYQGPNGLIVGKNNCVEISGNRVRVRTSDAQVIFCNKDEVDKFIIALLKLREDLKNVS